MLFETYPKTVVFPKLYILKVLVYSLDYININTLFFFPIVDKQPSV